MISRRLLWFTLVNSQGAETKVELSALKPSEEVLNFGWTRSAIESASKNGFYEVKAKITEENALAMQPNIAKDQFKEAVKLATDGKKRMAVKEVARALFNSLQPVQRFGIQAKWYDDVKDDMVRYTSAYDIAAFTLNPLGFNFKDGLLRAYTTDNRNPYSQNALQVSAWE